MRERGYLQGAVCPVIPTPVGTGVLIAGGNFNSTDHNWIYDNWRYGTMQFWVPAPLRDEMDPAKLYDTSHHNHTVGNQMGITPDGEIRHNGLDHWWDDEGEGNCWVGNRLLPRRADRQLHGPAASCADGGSPSRPARPPSRTPASSRAASTTATTRRCATRPGASGSTARPGRRPTRGSPLPARPPTSAPDDTRPRWRRRS